MRLIDRYLLREFLFWLVVFLAAFLLIWVAFDLSFQLHDLQQNHLRGKDVVELYFFKIPEFVPNAVPISILLAMLYTVTNHTRHNEITAIRAAGVSLVRLCMPYFAAGLVLSVLLFAFNEYFAPQADAKVDEIMQRRLNPKTAKTDPHIIKPLNFVNYGVAGKGGRTWNAAAYNTETFEMTRPLVAWTSTNGLVLALSATSAVWTNHTWAFSGEVVETLGPNRVLWTNHLVLPELTETPSEILSDARISESRATIAKTHRADIPLSDIVNYLRFHPQPDRKMRNWLFTKLHGRFAGPFTCLVCVIVAIPFSARSGRRNIFIGVAASIFIFIVYYFLQQIGLAFGESGWMPSWLGAWFPNLFFGIGGIFLMSRVR